MFRYEKELLDARVLSLILQEGGFLSDGAVVYRRDGPFYEQIPDTDLPTELRKLMTADTRMEISIYKLNNIIELMKQNPDIRICTDEVNTGVLVFRNGIYNVRDGDIHPLDGKFHWATVDAKYIANAKIEDAPTFLKFVSSSLDYPDKPEKTWLLLEIIGYALSDFTCAKKAFFLIGEPSSGKSKLLELLQRLMREWEVSQIPLARIGSRFNIGQLRGKRLNICTELPSNKFPDLDVFKALTACDRVYGELKGKDGFSFYPKAKLLCAGNNVPLPANSDGTQSVAERMVFLLFNHTISRPEWNVKLVEDLLQERDVICSLAVEQLKRLASSNFEFTLPEDSKVFAAAYQEALEAFRLFIRDTCALREGAETGSQRLWEAYLEFCSDNSLPKGIGQQDFVQKILLLDGVKKLRKRENGRQITIFKGIGIGEASDKWENTESMENIENPGACVEATFKKPVRSVAVGKNSQTILDTRKVEDILRRSKSEKKNDHPA